MCISDWRIGRLIRTVITTASLTNGQTMSINPNMQRVGIILGSNSGGLTATLSQIITIDGKVWSTLYAGNNPLILLMRDVGDLVTKSFVITCGVTSANVSMTELILPESILAENLDNLMRPYP